MKYILLLPLVLLVTLLLAQEVPVVHHPWQIGLVYAQDNQLPLGTFGPREPNGFDYTEDKSNATFGVSVIRNLNHHWSLRSGLLYANRDVTGVYYCQACDPTGEPHSLSIRYLTIPLGVRYQVPIQRFSIFGETGLATGFLLGSPRDGFPLFGRKTYKTALLESVSGIGGSIYLSDRFIAQIGMQYSQTLFHFDNRYGYEWRFRILSVQAGIQMGFGKIEQDKYRGQ